MKILIVDDDLGLLNSLRIGLSSYGHYVITVPDGPRALEKIESSASDPDPLTLLITDLRMPGMNGMELIQLAKKVRPNIHAILMTGYGSDKVKKETRRFESCGYINKPFTPEMLQRTIEETNTRSKDEMNLNS